MAACSLRQHPVPLAGLECGHHQGRTGVSAVCGPTLPRHLSCDMGRDRCMGVGKQRHTHGEGIIEDVSEVEEVHRAGVVPGDT